MEVLQEEDEEEDQQQEGERGEREQQDEHLPRQRSRRLAALQSEPLLASSPPNPPSSDLSWHPNDDNTSEPDDELHHADAEADNANLSSGDEDDTIQDAGPSSDDWLEDGDYSQRIVTRIRERLQDPDACLCGATRTFSIHCETEAQAEHLAAALRSHLSPHVDSGAILPSEAHVLTALQYVSSHHVGNSADGAPANPVFLKMGRFPFEQLPAESAAAEDMPIDADSGHRALRLEEAEGPVMGRRIRLPGQEITTIQLREGYVVYADAAAPVDEQA